MTCGWVRRRWQTRSAFLTEPRMQQGKLTHAWTKASSALACIALLVSACAGVDDRLRTPRGSPEVVPAATTNGTPGWSRMPAPTPASFPPLREPPKPTPVPVGTGTLGNWSGSGPAYIEVTGTEW